MFALDFSGSGFYHSYGAWLPLKTLWSVLMLQRSVVLNSNQWA